MTVMIIMGHAFLVILFLALLSNIDVAYSKQSRTNHYMSTVPGFTIPSS